LRAALGGRAPSENLLACVAGTDFRMAFLFTDSHLFKDKQAKLCILNHATQSIWTKGQLSKTDF